ncbi:hypothetical protein KP78_26620 [Jeotgalibacillus soli]|uniref:Uncharacterized protein n=1 Tax=Jeotgalibacillus soli TaxID=889306 RepID=A0A0C2VM83_9BACL|nr:hypothetical protein KP78_26620 [Jeotgalibacillus soli]
MNAMFFRKMSKTEITNWEKGISVGFYTYMTLLFIDYMSTVIFDRQAFTSIIIL